MVNVMLDATGILDLLNPPAHLIKSFRFPVESSPEINHEYHDALIFARGEVAKAGNDVLEGRIGSYSTIPKQSAIDNDAWKPRGIRSTRHYMLSGNPMVSNSVGAAIEIFKCFPKASEYLRRT